MQCWANCRRESRQLLGVVFASIIAVVIGGSNTCSAQALGPLLHPSNYAHPAQEPVETEDALELFAQRLTHLEEQWYASQQPGWVSGLPEPGRSIESLDGPRFPTVRVNGAFQADS